ncbi:putative Cyclopropane fatty acid synthase [Cocos nucifera]|uniref:Putative Cyclopropane fatty acid synthase n=1 Tax=Cocos nucifera TaxID=13894 RepID=A0A8K0N7M4_COCNU|nr:putative Cyclopropane fatty acid synthase [Cocos nucifera]
MRVAIVGAGISGLVSAYVLAKAGVDVVLYEKEDYLGGHARTVNFDGIYLDLGFMVFNGVTYPNMMEFFESLGVDMEISDMSFSVSLDEGKDYEWGSRNGLTSLFAQKSNVINPYFWQMLHEIIKFKHDVIKYLDELENNPDLDRNETLEHFIKLHGYSQLFQKAYLVPICASIWSCPSEGVMSFSAFSVLSFCRNHHLLQVKTPLISFSDIYLHHDKSLMPQNPSAWSAWNFLGTTNNGVCVTYWLNVLQNLGSTNMPFLVTLNPRCVPKHTLLKWTTSHPIPSVAASKASLELEKIQGKRGIWFCGAYQGFGFHEDGLKHETWDILQTGIVAANSVLGKDCVILRNPRHMVPSLLETGARLIVTRFLEKYVSTGCLTFLEEGGTIFVFEGTNKKSCVKSILKIHDPLFYWKVATEADLGLAYAYINRYFSVVDEQEGLLDLFMILIVNRDLNYSSKSKTRRGWWTPILFTAGLQSARYFLRHISRHNTVAQTPKNISCHYDLSNEFFSLFLDETMTYSSAIFKTENEDLKVAQLRKISLLIKKARIKAKHEILEIGCGWGSLAIEVVRQTGCKYTGITLSEEQLNEMIEGVGHEYMEDFFGCCESLLAEDGLFVLQFISIPDKRYDEYRRSSDFIKEYIFPGGCIPSLSRITSAMAATSRFCVEHVENIGIHYYETLRYWRNNFMQNKWYTPSLSAYICNHFVDQDYAFVVVEP